MNRIVWHPYTQMQTADDPIEVVSAEGVWLHTADGRKILDAISSWWVTVHGHSHPAVAKAIAEQAGTMEQVIFAGFTHPQAEKLSRRLIEAYPGDMRHVFFSDDGSTAVEVAIKMAWQYWDNRGEPRDTILALDGAYHGDTFGAMSVSGRSVFTKAFDPLLFDVVSLPFPTEESMDSIRMAIAQAGERAAALIVEPLVQGAGGMRMYSVALLDEIIRLCREHDVLVIFDEVMTGFGRTGSLFAAQQCGEQPDIVCLSKGLTGGFMPLSTTLCTEKIYEAFLSDDRTKTLFHGHSFTANPIGCAAANASMTLFETTAMADVERVTEFHSNNKHRIQEASPNAVVRQCGTILAMDFEADQTGYLSKLGPKMASYFLDRDILLRPLGQVLYFLPPYCITNEELEYLYNAVIEGIRCGFEKGTIFAE